MMPIATCRKKYRTKIIGVHMPKQQTPPTYGGIQATNKGRALGIIALILGLVGPLLLILFFALPEQLVILFFLAYPVVVTGLILGIISLVKSRRGHGSKAFGLAGTIVSSITLVISILFIVLLIVLGLFIGNTLGDSFPQFF